MNLSHRRVAVRQSHLRNAIHFSPVAKSVLLSQQRKVTNAVALGYGFDIGNHANDFDFHLYFLRLSHKTIKDASAFPFTGCQFANTTTRQKASGAMPFPLLRPVRVDRFRVWHHQNSWDHQGRQVEGQHQAPP